MVLGYSYSYEIGYDSKDRPISLVEFVPNMEEILGEDDERDPHLFISYRNKIPLRQFLNMGLREFVEKYPQYEFLNEEINFNSIKNQTFADIIYAVKELGYKYQFYMINGIIKAFSTFKFEKGRIDGFKVLSLDPTGESIIFLSVIKMLFLTFINSRKVSKISWGEAKTSPTNVLYKELINRYNGKIMEVDDVIYYRIDIDR